MAKWKLMEEFHLSISVPPGLSDPDALRIRLILDDARFRAGLSRAIRTFVASQPDLMNVGIRLSR